MPYLFVEDDGVDISEEVIEEFRTTRQMTVKGSKMMGIGLGNVDTCIRIIFGKEHGLRLE